MITSEKTVDFDDISVDGNLSEGRISSITNAKTTFKITFPGTNIRWFLEIEGVGRQKLTPDDFSYEKISDAHGRYFNSDNKITIDFLWQKHSHDALKCEIRMSVNNPSVFVRYLHFFLPGEIRVAENGADETLIYPVKSGMRVENPCSEFLRPLIHKVSSYGHGTKPRNVYVTESGIFPVAPNEIPSEKIDFGQDYPGGSSMPWMDYFGPAGGIYLGMHDRHFEPTTPLITVSKSGIEMGMKKTFNRRSSAWCGDVVIALHDGDWHRGADIYRSFFRSVSADFIKAPDYVRKSNGIVCHYDFKWEDGIVHHRFNEIPSLFLEAQNHGLTNMLIAGWNQGGHDFFALEYAPDPDLGTEDELKRAIATVHARGGKMFFYVNVLAISRDRPEFETFGRKAAVKKPDGEIDYFGEISLFHPLGIMCNSVKEWRNAVKRNIKYVINDLGADGVYTDQLGSNPRVCCDPKHNHEKAWIDYYRDLLGEIRTELKNECQKDVFLFCEYPMDVYAPVLDGFLSYSFWVQGVSRGFPEMLRYTFPNMVLIDMVMQKPWPANEPIEDPHVKNIFCHQFVTGLYYWTYCHVLRHPDFSKFFDAALKLRMTGIDFFADGEYRDDVSIINAPSGVMVKEFSLKDKGSMFAVWNRTGKAGRFNVNRPINGTATTSDVNGIRKNQDLRKNSDPLSFSDAELCLVFTTEPAVPMK